VLEFPQQDTNGSFIAMPDAETADTKFSAHLSGKINPCYTASLSQEDSTNIKLRPVIEGWMFLVSSTDLSNGGFADKFCVPRQMYLPPPMFVSISGGDRIDVALPLPSRQTR